MFIPKFVRRNLYNHFHVPHKRTFDSWEVKTTKKKIVTYAAPILLLTLAISVGTVFAGSQNQNGENGTQGTAKVNDMDGCRPDVQAGSGYIRIFPGPGGLWEGGPCCAAHSTGPVEYVNGNPVYESNECCNPPDSVNPQPGNHCECFHLRGYPVV